MLVMTGGDGDTGARPEAATAMARAEKLLDRVATGDIAVLLAGETGAGKEVFAERIHARQQARARSPLLRLNCGGFSETLLDSELFGHEKGAFTGADRAKPGLLENADGGTVFLDEIGELPLALQARLLRVLQDKKVQRVGALAPRAIDVRFIAATNRDLAAEIAAGRFRQDLYYRLDGVTVVDPAAARARRRDPRRSRRSSSRAARPARAAVARGASRGSSATRGRATSASSRTSIERAALIADDEIAVEHLQLGDDAAAAPPRAGALHADVEALERDRIVAALEACGGNQTRAAQQLGIARGTLVARMKQFGIKRPRT